MKPYPESIPFYSIPKESVRIIRVAPQEDWVDIQGFDGNYKISSQGEIWSRKSTRGIKPNHWLKLNQFMSTYNYLYVGLSNNGSRKNFFVHRLVATTFVPNFDNKPYINHINGVKTDNRADNLEWVTAKENVAHAYNIGLRDNRGEKHYRAKLSSSDVLAIRRKCKVEGIPQKDLANEYKINANQISRIMSGTRWKHI